VDVQEPHVQSKRARQVDNHRYDWRTSPDEVGQYYTATSLTCRLTLPSAPTAVSIQALGIIQNYLADGTLADLSNAVEKLGEARLLGAIQNGNSQGVDKELRVAVCQIRKLR
jgi:hypothetical protein